MSYPTKHPWSLRYVLFKMIALLCRGLAVPAVWLGINYLNKHGVPGVSRRVERVRNRDGRRTIRLNVYEKDAGKGRIGAKQPVLVNFHGSGFVINGLGADDRFCALTAARINCIVIDSDYRKAPEAPFPAGLHDAEDVTRWVLSQGHRFDVSRVSLSGFSAGGNLALSTGCSLGPDKIQSVAAFYPVVDRSVTPFEERAPDAQPHWLMGYLFRYFDRCYTVSDEQGSDPRISVTRAAMERFPRTIWIVCGGRDVLYVESRVFVNKLKAAGHENATFVGLPHQLHGFDKEGPDSKVLSVEYYAKAADVIANSWE